MFQRQHKRRQKCRQLCVTTRSQSSNPQENGGRIQIWGHQIDADSQYALQGVLEALTGQKQLAGWKQIEEKNEWMNGRKKEQNFLFSLLVAILDPASQQPFAACCFPPPCSLLGRHELVCMSICMYRGHQRTMTWLLSQYVYRLL